jgi:transcription elongation GreA/GreB family factor
MSSTRCAPSFSKLAGNYLNSLTDYREAKAAVSVAQRLGQDTREMEYHAARQQERHQRAVVALVARAVELRGGGRA